MSSELVFNFGCSSFCLSCKITKMSLNVTKPPGKKHTSALNRGLAQIILTDLSTSPPYFYRGSKSAKFFLAFRPFRALWLRNGAKTQKSKTTVYSTDVWALICRRPSAARVTWDLLAEHSRSNTWDSDYCNPRSWLCVSLPVYLSWGFA